MVIRTWTHEFYFVKQPNELIHIQPKGVDIYEIGKKPFVNVLSRLTDEKKENLM